MLKSQTKKYAYLTFLYFYFDCQIRSGLFLLNSFFIPFSHLFIPKNKTPVVSTKGREIIFKSK